MLTRGSRRLVSAACALAAALALAGCGGDEEKTTEAPSDASAGMVRLAETCGGVFDKETAAEATRPPGPERVRPVKAESPAEAAAGLSREKTWGGGHDLCVLENGRGEELLSPLS